MAVELASYHTSPWTSNPWFKLVPELSLSADFQSIMLLPFQAMIAAFSALLSNDASLRAVAYRCYSDGLKRHQAQFDQLVPWQKHQHSASILNLLLMSMALLEFEMMAPLGTDSWLPHAHGVLSLLEQVGPHGCQVSPFFEIFWQLRFFMVYSTPWNLFECLIEKLMVVQSYIALSTRRTSLLGTRDWMEIPFLHRGKTDFDLVIDTLLLLDTRLTIEDDGGTNTGKPEQSRKTLISGLSTESIYASSTPITGSEQIIRILVNLRELVSAHQSNNSETQITLSTAILEDSKLLLSQPSLPFNVSLQVISAMSLVVQYAPDSLQKQDAAQLYADWHGRLLLMA